MALFVQFSTPPGDRGAELGQAKKASTWRAAAMGPKIQGLVKASLCYCQKDGKESNF